MSRLLALALLICIYVFAAPACMGQQAASPSQAKDPVTSGIIRGAVTDTQGAAVAGASIKVIHIQTGRVFKDKSDDEGRFNVGGLPSGTYELEVSAPGFVTSRLLDITLNKDTASAPHNTQSAVGGTVAELDVHLSVSETVTVCIVCGYTYFSVPYGDLPLKNRDPQRLVALQSGVTEHKQDFSIAGNRLTAKTVLLNGFDNRDPVTGGFIASPSLSGLQEFNSDYQQRRYQSGLAVWPTRRGAAFCDNQRGHERLPRSGALVPGTHRACGQQLLH
jgi:hypothetical protein